MHKFKSGFLLLAGLFLVSFSAWAHEACEMAQKTEDKSVQANDSSQDKAVDEALLKTGKKKTAYSPEEEAKIAEKKLQAKKHLDQMKAEQVYDEQVEAARSVTEDRNASGL